MNADEPIAFFITWTVTEPIFKVQRQVGESLVRGRHLHNHFLKNGIVIALSIQSSF